MAHLKGRKEKDMQNAQAQWLEALDYPDGK